MGVGAPVNWGILSTADINRKVIPGAHASAKVELIAVASRDLRGRRRTRAKWEIDARLRLVRGAARGPEVEAVYISLPNTLHCEWSIRALEAGKHVLCEKPMSRHVADVEAAFDAAEQGGAHPDGGVHVSPQPTDQAARQLVDEGAIGDVAARAVAASAIRCTTRTTSGCGRRWRVAA